MIEAYIEGFVGLPCGHVIYHTYIENGSVIECRGLNEDHKGRIDDKRDKCKKKV